MFGCFYNKLKNIFKKKERIAPPAGNCQNIFKLQKSLCNPIIEPKKRNLWESWQTFNPAVVFLGNKIHFLYRAIGEEGVSVLGHASSEDGVSVDERSEKPVYVLRKKFLERLEESEPSDSFNYSSGGSVAGCEDPRIVEIDDTVYMTHTTFSSWSHLRVTLTSIKKEDFLNKRWGRWKNPVFISPPCEVHKNWVLFPEKINGKFAFLHSISPEIMIDYFDSLDYFNGKNFIKSQYFPSRISDGWESYRRGAGPPPIKTDKGWLLIYHGIDKEDSSKYKLGAMILDYSDPTKITHISKEPILEPNSFYENNGHKRGVVYSCGAVVIKGTLLVYYGGADSVSCVATAPLDEFMNSFVETEKPKIKKIFLLNGILRRIKHGFN